jgi:hypothetical protein
MFLPASLLANGLEELRLLHNVDEQQEQVEAEDNRGMGGVALKRKLRATYSLKLTPP